MKATILGAFALISLLACATVNLPAAVDDANKAVTIILTSTDAAYNAKLITKKQGEAVSIVARQIEPLLDSAAAAAAAGDTAGANKTMTLINALIAGLNAYVPPVPPTATGAK